MIVKLTKSNFNIAFHFLPNDQIIPKIKKWKPYNKEVIVFFADFFERIRQFTVASEKFVSTDTPRILIVDDDEDDRLLFEEAISNIEPLIQVDIARSGMELVNLMKKGSPPEIVFLDLNMPGKTGKECLAEIRRHESWKKIPVFIYSTSANRSDILDTYKAGANLYLLKPTSFSELIRMLKKAFTFDWEKIPSLSQNDFLLKHN